MFTKLTETNQVSVYIAPIVENCQYFKSNNLLKLLMLLLRLLSMVYSWKSTPLSFQTGQIKGLMNLVNYNLKNVDRPIKQSELCDL